MADWLSRRRYHCAIASLAAGLAAAGLHGPAAPALAAAVTVALCCCRLWRSALVAALLASAGLAAGSARLAAIDAPGERVQAWSTVTGTAVLLERPRPVGARFRALVQLTSGRWHGARVLATSERPWSGGGRGWRDAASVAPGTDRGAATREPGADTVGLSTAALEPGAELRLRGLVRPARPDEPGEFDQAAWFRRRGIAAELELASVEPTGRRRGGLAGLLDAARRRAERGLSAGLPPERAALARGMVLGQDEAIDQLTRDDWRDAGLAHLLAVSGQNVMLLCALALPLLALARAGSVARIACLLALIALYVPLAGAGPSLQRAAVMGAAGIVAVASARAASASYALLLAAAATLALNPRVWGEPGWQLSFVAVIGILALAPRLRPPDLRDGLARAAARALAHGAGLTVAATAATAPLLAHHFQAIPLVAVPANLAALPAVAPVMWIGMLQAALGQTGDLGEPAALLLAQIGESLLAYLQWIARGFAAHPHAVAETGTRGPLVLAVVYAALATLVVAWRTRRARRAVESALGPLWAAGAPTRAWPAGALGRFPRSGLAALAAALLLAVATQLLHPPPPPGWLTVSFLDVGQGDATLIQDPAGASVLFDGGPQQARVARLLRQAGVRRLGLLVATHASADHHGGLLEVVRRLPVDLLLDGGDGTRDPAFAALLREARRRRIRVLPARAGQTLRVGSIGVRVLSPPPRPAGPPPADPNPRAVVALISSGAFDLLLSADAESPALEPLALPDVEAIKVPHHGSSDPGLPDLLERLRPEVAVITVGENSYGHPHPATLAALDAAVPHVRRTDRDGSVRIELSGRGGFRLRP